MTLLNLHKVNEETFEQLKQGHTEVLEKMDANTKINYGLALQKEYGTSHNQQVNKDSVGAAFEKLLQQQRDTEENAKRMREEQLEREAKEWARKVAATRMYY